MQFNEANKWQLWEYVANKQHINEESIFEGRMR
jgi:hypothetical protein